MAGHKSETSRVGRHTSRTRTWLDSSTVAKLGEKRPYCDRTVSPKRSCPASIPDRKSYLDGLTQSAKHSRSTQPIGGHRGARRALFCDKSDNRAESLVPPTPVLKAVPDPGSGSWESVLLGAHQE